MFEHQNWQEKGLWEDPCLRIGWIQGLKNLLQHPAALDFFVKSGDICRERDHPPQCVAHLERQFDLSAAADRFVTV